MSALLPLVLQAPPGQHDLDPTVGPLTVHPPIAQAPPGQHDGPAALESLSTSLEPLDAFFLNCFCLAGVAELSSKRCLLRPLPELLLLLLLSLLLSFFFLHCAFPLPPGCWGAVVLHVSHVLICIHSH